MIDQSANGEEFVQSLQEMIQLQKLHNQDVHVSWDLQGYPFHRAIWCECAELMDHYGWKWWKHQTTDLAQVKLEIVDIWHFGLSMVIIEQRDLGGMARQMATLISSTTLYSFHEAVEQLAQQALNRIFDIGCFVKVMTTIPMSLGELYGIYKGKHVLNRFRQANGYQDGSYRKMWNGFEDNVHLANLVQELDVFANDFTSKLRVVLQERYQETT